MRCIFMACDARGEELHTGTGFWQHHRHAATAVGRQPKQAPREAPAPEGPTAIKNRSLENMRAKGTYFVIAYLCVNIPRQSPYCRLRPHHF
jgi:hypothetical protein